MLKRQIFLLSLLEEFGSKLPNTEMLKYLFLLTRFQDDRIYHFFPYKYGCFSFNVYADKRKLIEKGILRNSDDWSLSNNQGNYYLMLSRKNRALIKKIKKEFGHLHGNDLIRYIYLEFPYYAVNSEILDEVLSSAEISKVKTYRPRKKIKAIYTIGYEKRSIEEYINCLIQEDVKILCDVRENPVSRKYGFSKTTLRKALETVGIGYRHFPELGIPGKKRKFLYHLEDYNRLFDLYEKEVLDNRQNTLDMIYQLLINNDRVGLTCYERLPEYCHRTRVAKAVITLSDQNLSIIEL
jgi:uncharacterized protein (DUF488 family)